MEKLIGHVLWYNSQLGIGTIEDSRSGDKYSVSFSDVYTINKTLFEEDLVSFIPMPDYSAKKVTLIL